MIFKGYRYANHPAIGGRTVPPRRPHAHQNSMKSAAARRKAEREVKHREGFVKFDKQGLCGN